MSRKTSSRKKAGIIIAVTVVVLLMLVMQIPWAVAGWYNSVTGQETFCNSDPYNEKCVCNLNQRRVYVPWIGIPRWHCENLAELILDPESPNFEYEAIAFVKQYLNRYCGSVCTDLQCGGSCIGANPTYPETRCISAVFGYGSTGERLVNVECVEVTEWDSQNRPSSGTLPWRMNFYVESATQTPVTIAVHIQSNYCLNPERTTKCTHQSFCEAYGNPDWCVPQLPLEVRQELLSILPGLGSRWPVSII